jgi:hypothetical protein
MLSRIAIGIRRAGTPATIDAVFGGTSGSADRIFPDYKTPPLLLPVGWRQ